MSCHHNYTRFRVSMALETTVPGESASVLAARLVESVMCLQPADVRDPVANDSSKEKANYLFFFFCLSVYLIRLSSILVLWRTASCKEILSQSSTSGRRHTQHVAQRVHSQWSNVERGESCLCGNNDIALKRLLIGVST